MTVYLRGRFAEAYKDAKPMKFMGRVLPEYFTATFYLIDNDGIKVKEDNFKKFKTCRVEILLRTTKAESVDLIRIEARGSETYKGHTVFTTKADNPDDFGTLQARHLNALHENRSRFIAFAVTTCLQVVEYKGEKSGRHLWSSLGQVVDIPGEELERIADAVTEWTYTKIDGTFLQTFADRYRKHVEEGDKTPIKTLQNLYYPDKSLKHVQSYATKCRKRGLLPDAPAGKNSPVRKKRQGKEKGK